MPKLCRFLALIIALFCGVAMGEPSDDGAHYEVNVWDAGVTPKDVPQVSVVAMIQAHNGYLWLGTLDGLARFDGDRFVVFRQINTPGLNDNQIIHLFEDSRGSLWIGTASEGVVLVKDGKVHSLGIGRGTKLMASCEDSLGAVWLYTADGFLTRWFQGKAMRWQVPESNCRSMIAEKDGYIWVATDSRLYGIDPKANLVSERLGDRVVPFHKELPLQFLLRSEKSGFWVIGDGRIVKVEGGKKVRDLGLYPWSKPVASACEDLEGNLIVGTLGDGIYWFDATGKQRHLTSQQGLSHNYILSLVMDHEGSLWVGTDGGGLNQVKRQPFSVLPGTEALVVQSVCEDAAGNIWMNTRDGLRFCTNGVLSSYRKAEGLFNINGQSVFVDKDQTVWAGCVGSDQSLFKFNPSGNHFETVPLETAGMNAREVSVIFQDHGSNLWFGCKGGLLRRDAGGWKLFNHLNGLSFDTVQAIAEDSEGALWIGTTAGLNRLKDGVFTAFHTSNGLPGENVSSILVDEQGVMWVGTQGTGLGRYENGKWTHYSTAQGLLSDSLGYLLDDGAGNLWIGSRGGLLRTRKEELNQFAKNPTNSFSCYAYGKKNGLVKGECTIGSQPGAIKGRDGRLWFPTISGLASVDPSGIHRNTNPPPVLIESVLVADELQNTNPLQVRLPSLITVPAGKEGIEIRFTSLNLSSADRAKFKYRLVGYETAWKFSQARSVSYAKLPAGHYVFRVSACNEDGVWSESEATVAFFIEPPFWQTWWFLTASLLALVGIIVGVVHYLSTQRLQKQLEGMRQQQALEKERARIARDIHDQLGASMTQISLLSEMVESDKNEPGEVESHAQQITQAARDTSRVLDEIVWTVNPSNDTMEGLINYICKYAQEYFAVANVRYRLDVPSQLPDAEVTPEVRHNVFLASKEAITNVVKHAKASEVKLRMKLLENSFILEVQDNGKEAINLTGKETRNGLRNMRKRMEDVGGNFELVAAPEGGAIARLTVPIKHK